MTNPQHIFGQNKILQHQDKLMEWQLGRDNTLITAEIDLTNRCNHKCPKCTGWAKGLTADQLDTGEAKSYITELSEHGVRGLIFTGGGEPLLHPDVYELIDYAWQDKLDVGLITNGTLLPDYDVWAQRLLLSRCKWIRVSLDAGDPETYMRTHGMPEKTFSTTLSRIRSLCVQRTRMKTPEPIIGTGYLTGLGTSSYDQMARFVEWSLDLGVDYAQFRPMHYDQTDVKDHILDLQREYNRETFKVTASWQKYNRFGEKSRPYRVCHGINFCTTIGADAKVYLCCHKRGMPGMVLGDLRTQPFTEIWANRQKVFDRLVNLDAICPPLCRCDEFNRLLWEMDKPKTHINFL